METGETSIHVVEAYGPRVELEAHAYHAVVGHGRCDVIEIRIDGVEHQRLTGLRIDTEGGILGGWRARAAVLARALVDIDRGDLVVHGHMRGGPAMGGMWWEPNDRHTWRSELKHVSACEIGGVPHVAVAEASDADLAHAEPTARVLEEWRLRHPHEEQVRGWAQPVHAAAWRGPRAQRVSR